MSVNNSILTTALAGIPIRITVTVELGGGSQSFTADTTVISADSTLYTADQTLITYTSTVISVIYDGIEILEPTVVTDTYEFDYTPDESGGILTVVSESGITGSTKISNKYKNYHTPYNNGEGVIVFKSQGNKWTSHLTFTPDRFETLGDNIYSFYNGVPFIHTGDKATFYYDDQQPSVLSFRVSGINGVVKILEYMALETDVRPDYTHVISENPYTQATDLCLSDFVYTEGTFMASLLNDKLSPNFTDASESTNYAQALINGDEMRAKWFDIFFIFNNETEFSLSAVNLGLTTSSGHRK